MIYKFMITIATLMLPVAGFSQEINKEIPHQVSEGNGLAIFGAGCFWKVEHRFGKVPGVVSTMVGYSGGDLPNPSYHQVCSGNTGHAEVVRVEYDPNLVSYPELLEVFWKVHDPTQLNRQGYDVGRQYRSVIYYQTEEQLIQALDSRDRVQEVTPKPIVTQIDPAAPFYRAEEYHQHYLSR